ncbi:MAG: type II toxin-antitoxin system HicB family antitoxin [Rhodospirillales bacterium]|nr:type II toxin-antitoxin system HicB family antitoxin [Rhodospirillales bacterium]
MGNSLPRFEIEPLSQEDGGGYLIRFPDYPGCIADGETPEEAIAEGRDALQSYVETLKELGRPIPKAGEDAFSGKWSQRVPRSLHAALARRAALEGVSFNTLCVALLAEGIGKRE